MRVGQEMSTISFSEIISDKTGINVYFFKKNHRTFYFHVNG